jgi:uncharacterized protein with HEPN domain
MKQSDDQRIKKILDTSEKLYALIKNHGITEEQVLNDYSVQWMVTTPLYNIGEQVYNISGELKSQHPDIPWNQISGLRHRLVHNYEGTNWSIINRVIFDDLPIFVSQLQEIIS